MSRGLELLLDRESIKRLGLFSLERGRLRGRRTRVSNIVQAVDQRGRELLFPPSQTPEPGAPVAMSRGRV